MNLPIPTHAPPPTPGEILLEEYIKPLGLSQVAFAEQIGVPIQRLNGLIRGRRAVSADTALLLAEHLNTTPEFWLNLQAMTDLYAARERRAREAARAPKARPRAAMSAKARPAAKAKRA